MSFDRRRFGAAALTLGAVAALPRAAWAATAGAIDTAGLMPMTDDVKLIDAAERAGRLARAQELMAKAGIAAIVLEPGASLDYFTGVQWWRSERLTAAVIPARGEAIVITPFFEEPSVRQSLGIPASVRVWQEDEDPLALLAGALKDRGAGSGRIGIEETVRFFASDGLAQRLPGARLVSANPIVRGCRMIKTPAEIALMQAANDVTTAAFRWTWPRIREGMTPGEIAAHVNAATTVLGGTPTGALVLLGEASAYPHGSRKPQAVREGEVVLLDCGCSVGGYASDISRSFVLGKAPDAVRRVWDIVAQGQQVARGAARIGAPAGSIDDAVRRFYQAKGFGPGYQLPGLSHRTGHGIGMDGHEPVNLVHGEATPLAPGMCFSNEPGLYLPGQFGVRLEDCFHMTAAGPEWFSVPPTSLDKPFG
ncbi:M24 family metallopeptidase [Polymorphobacter fuscus]|uniref:M24 family metallopeptidase n=1 Tax=Sandarakinorhabdus fusca TaxID=1439888 RepID=A0A7C9KXS8_9SPHN|nr:Xaa-Pro peptidase family protein [Polymorphobacter fuscus]KAB7644981.1 aminopeptidase P family protein [Polymorphobacter fuscus]MQT18145.1 M24 family metallopeptidase [Polymorphobacter fuscus]